jgi:hypothetical protein
MALRAKETFMKMPVVFAMIACSLAGCSETGDSMRKRKPDVVVDTAELMHEVDVNRLEPDKLNAKYKGKVVEVRDATLFGEPRVNEKGTVLLHATWLPKDTGWFVSCHVIPSENGTLTKYSRFSRIHFKGKYSKVEPGFSSTFFVLEDCIAVD